MDKARTLLAPVVMLVAMLVTTAVRAQDDGHTWVLDRMTYTNRQNS